MGLSIVIPLYRMQFEGDYWTQWSPQLFRIYRAKLRVNGREKMTSRVLVRIYWQFIHFTKNKSHKFQLVRISF